MQGATGAISGKGKIGAYVDYTARRYAISTLISEGRTLASWLRGASHDIRDWILSYHHATAFFEDWQWLRMMIDLQTRLFIEQVLTNMGEPWSKAVTGFSAMSRGKSELRGRGRAERIPSKKSKRHGRYIPTARW